MFKDKPFKKQAVFADDVLYGYGTEKNDTPVTVPKKTNTDQTKTDTETTTTTPVEYNSTPFGLTTKGAEMWEAATGATGAYKEGIPFTYSNDLALKSIMGQILAGQNFKYDFNEDAMYQQYKDAYARQAKLASQDVMGQAAAMTGGYGNSYAASVGNQAYQAEIGKINDVIPELYQLALDRHNMEQNQLMQKYSAYADDYNRQYTKHLNKLSALGDVADYKHHQYDVKADEYYTLQGNKNANAWKQAEFDREQIWRDEDIALNSVAAAADYEKWLLENGFSVDPETGAIVSASGQEGLSTAILNNMANFSTIEDFATYLKSLEESGEINEEEAFDYLAKYESEIGGKSLTNRHWTVVNDGNGDFLGMGINRNAKIQDEFGNTYTLAELRKELTKTMTREEANKWINDLSAKLGIKT